MATIGTTVGVYLGARDLAGYAAIGTHLFVVVVTGNNSPMFVPYVDPNTAGASLQKMYKLTPQDLGDGTLGIVAGAQRKQGRLMMEYFETSDYQATREHYNWSKHGSYGPDFDTELHAVGTAKGVSAAAAIPTVMGLLKNYVENESAEPIPYPDMGWGLNSNSWAQSVVEYAGCTAPGDYSGLDLSGGERLPKAYFTPHHFGKRLPMVNGKTVSNLALAGETA